MATTSQPTRAPNKALYLTDYARSAWDIRALPATLPALYPHDGDQVSFDLVQHPVRADAQPAVGTADERARRAANPAVSTKRARRNPTVRPGTAAGRGHPCVFGQISLFCGWPDLLRRI